LARKVPLRGAGGYCNGGGYGPAGILQVKVSPSELSQ
jgi:hypothetical protein